ncbi:MAG: CHAT domain-containing protein, partial [Alloprevotella sp.]
MPRLLLLLFWLCVSFASAQQTLTFDQRKKFYERLAVTFENADNAYRAGRIQSADSLSRSYCQQCLALDTATLHHSFNYAYMLEVQAHYAAYCRLFDKAIETENRVIALRCELLSDNEAVAFGVREFLGVSFNEQALFHSYKGDYAGAIDFGSQAVETFEIYGLQNVSHYPVALSNLAAYYSSRAEKGDYEKAIEMGERALTILKKNTPAYANALNSLIVYYSQAGQTAKAEQTAALALKAAEKIYGSGSLEYATLLSNLSVQYASMNRYDRAVEYAVLSRDLYRANADTLSLPYARLLTNLATFHSNLENHEESIALLTEALPIISRIEGEGHVDYVRCRADLSAAYNKLGDTQKAEEVSRASGGLSVEAVSGTTDLRMAYALSKEAGIQAAAGNFLRACELENQAGEVFRERGDSLALANSFILRSGYLNRMRRFDEALDLVHCAMPILKRNGGDASLPQAYNNLSIIHYHNGDNAKACEAALLAIDAYREQGDTLSSFYAKTLANLSLYLSLQDSLSLALSTTVRAIQVMQRVLGENHPDNAPLFFNAAHYGNLLRDSLAVADFYHKALRIQNRAIRNNFSHKTAHERETYWNTKNYLYRVAPTFAYMNPRCDSLIADAYDAKLFTNGLLLNSEINFRKLLLQVKDSVMLEKYNRLDLLRREIEAGQQENASESAARLAAAEQEAEQLEKELVVGCKEYGDFMANLSTGWRDVAASLSENDLAVEFVSLHVGGLGTTYAALMLRKDAPCPVMRILFSDYDLRQLRYGDADFFAAVKTRKGLNAVYRDTALTRLVWQPVLDYMPNVRRIYFSPSGLLHQFAVEYLPLDSTRIMSDLYGCHRLSSTARLCEKRTEENTLHRAVVFGGLNYNTELSTLISLRQRREWEEEERFILSLADDEAYDLAANEPTDSLLTRSGYGYLPGTLTEAEQIGELLMQENVPTLMRLGEYGTEESFKALGGRDYSLMHIATHGFYHTASSATADGAQTASGDEQGSSDSGLNSCGLLLSGANTILAAPERPKEVEDGVLTAREISTLDFRKVGLVVLSACKTGVGEVREDGVFGLQRGFKKAGVRSLIMSLWDVNDAATQRMMSSFYEGLTQRISLHEAFSKARREMRHNGFDDPVSWAAFIIL